MKKHPIRILSLSLALAMSVTLAAPVSAASLADVEGPYARSIESLAEKGIIKGDGTRRLPSRGTPDSLRRCLPAL